MAEFNVAKYYNLTQKSYFDKLGKVSKIVGLTIESIGPDAKLNDLCVIHSADNESHLYAEVVGFKDSRVLLMPFDNVDGIGPGCIVENTEKPLAVKVGDAILGHTLDGLGNPMNGEELGLTEEYSVEAQPPDPMSREIISQVLPLGVKAVDGLLTVGKGQRIGIFAGSGVGKSTLLGMFARNTKADINVIALIGERGREVREFVERDLGPEGMKRSVLVVATSDKPALIRNKAAKTATAIAEYFRDQGKDVLLMMDSLTRFSMAQREIGLASGEPPVTRGYPPSVYAEDLPYSLEQIILKCTQKSVNRRYDKMEDVIADLKHSLIEPQGDFVKLSSVDNDAKTVVISDEELGEIKHSPKKRTSDIAQLEDEEYDTDYDDGEDDFFR